jgi:hypothetical protein
VFIAFLLVLLDDLFVAGKRILLLLGLLGVVIAFLLEALLLVLQMLDSLPQVRIGLLDADGLFSFSEVFALSIIELLLCLQLLFFALFNPGQESRFTGFTVFQSPFILFKVDLRNPRQVLLVFYPWAVFGNLLLLIFVDLTFQVSLCPLEVLFFGLQTLSPIQDLVVLSLYRLDVVIQLLEKCFILS